MCKDILSPSFDFMVPEGWEDLSEKQLRSLYRIMAVATNRNEAKLLFLFRINRIQVIGRQPDGRYLLKEGTLFFQISPLRLADVCVSLDWMDSFPKKPVRFSRIGMRKAKAPDLEDTSFEDWLILDNLYQGFIQTRDDSILDDMSEALYGRRMNLSEVECLSVFFWMASVKALFARRWPNFLRPDQPQAEGSGPEPLAAPQQSAQEAYLTQIRALTKGDLTKRDRILALPCHVALAELDALAREYEEFNSKHKS